MTYLVFCAGLLFLILGAQVLIKGAVAIAQRFSIPPLNCWPNISRFWHKLT